MRNKFTALLLTAVLLLLPGCTLAREIPEGSGGEQPFTGDRFIGVYVVREEPSAQIDRTHWVEYGSSSVETEFGSFPMPQEILIGQYDEETRDITFPGMEGYALFAMNVNSEERGSYHTVVSDMIGGNFHVKSTDAGDSYELSGTLYYGPPVYDPYYDSWEDDRVWHHYKVYQMADGTVFLSGHGDSHSGGGGVGLTQTETYTATVNGEEMEYYTRVEVRVEYIERLTSLTVRQYSADGQLLQTSELPVEGDIPIVNWMPEADWAVVEELRGGELTRTVYDRPSDEEETVSHQIVLLEDDGMGYAGSIRFK